MKDEKIVALKAKDLVKKDTVLDDIYDSIFHANKAGYFKVFIPSHRYLTIETQIELMENGFKVYKGDWDVMKDVYIIEW